VIELPKDKSIAQRCAVLNLDFDESFIGEDVKSTLEAANQFAQYSKNLTLNLGNSGTGIRLLTGYIAGSGKKCTLIGDKSLSNRPMRRISDPLNNWGAKISLREDKYPPIEIAESKLLSNFVYELEIPSAQIKSCLLFAALSSKTKIEIIENIPSRDHTERLLQECDAEIFREGNKIIFDGAREITKKFIDVPKDFSSAAYLIAANILTNKDIPLKGIGVNKTRTAFLNVLEEMGAKIELNNACIISNEPRADITARFDTNLKGVSISGKSIPNLIDEIPLIAILAMFAEGKTTIRDAKELRYKESDRITLLLDNMKKFNPNIGLTEFEDGFEIIPSKNHDNDSVDLETGGDHRIIMSFVIAALVTGKKINFDETESVETSFPGFFEVIKAWYQ
jgi:3-phosphoshikimate 1-carboxyvinyltransferase